MLEFEIQLNGYPIGSLTISDEYQAKITELRESYFDTEDAAGSVMLPVSSSIAAGTYLSMRPDMNRHKPVVSNSLLDIGKDYVVCTMTLDGSMKIRYDISKSF